MIGIFLSIFPSKMINYVGVDLKASELSEEYLNFMIKYNDENPSIDLRLSIDFDTKEFKAFTLKIYKLIC